MDAENKNSGAPSQADINHHKLRDFTGKFATRANAVELDPTLPFRQIYPDSKCIKEATKTELVRCVHSLTKSIHTLKAEMEDPNASRLSFLMATAIKKHDTKFIAWMIEMAIGKPKQTIEQNNKEATSFTINYEVADGIETAIVNES